MLERRGLPDKLRIAPVPADVAAPGQHSESGNVAYGDEVSGESEMDVPRGGTGSPDAVGAVGRAATQQSRDSLIGDPRTILFDEEETVRSKPGKPSPASSCLSRPPSVSFPLQSAFATNTPTNLTWLIRATSSRPGSRASRLPSSGQGACRPAAFAVHLGPVQDPPTSHSP